MIHKKGSIFAKRINVDGIQINIVKLGEKNKKKYSSTSVRYL